MGAAEPGYLAEVAHRQRIPRDARSDILDWLAMSGKHWAGQMEEPDFLGRVFDLSVLPSTDRRYRDAAGDIYQHRVANPQDWDDNWVFGDHRFDLLGCDDDLFLAFLVQTVHPLARRDRDEAEQMVATYNQALRPLGIELYEATTRLGNLPVFTSRDTTGHHAPARARLAEQPDLVDRAVLRRHLRRIDRDIDADPAAAIDSSKNLLETLFKIVLRDRAVAHTDRDDLPALFRKVSNELGINADAIPDNQRGSEALRLMLRTLTTTVQAVGETRNSLGDGHGTVELSPALPRHARLAFNATVAVSEFVVDAWQATRG